MATAWTAARSAIAEVLRTDIDLLVLLGAGPTSPVEGRVFDGEPAKVPQVLPYVVVGEAVEDPNNRMGGAIGRTVTIPVHCWSATATDGERDEVAGRVDELLDNNLDLVVAGYDVELFNLLGIQYLTDSPIGGKWTATRHAILRFRLDVKRAA